MRALLMLPGLAGKMALVVSCGASAPGTSQPELSGAEPRGEAFRRPSVDVLSRDRTDVTKAKAHVAWCASGGAPIVGTPVVDHLERAYIATSDGYVHAFERDGRFRWSYTVKGTPLGSVSLRPSDGAILMGTTGRFIYAINQDGSLRFRYPTLTPVWSGLFALNDSTVVFLGQDNRLYALGNNGERRYRVKAPSDPMGGPVVAAGDVVWLPLIDGVARFEAAFRLQRFPLPAALEEVVVLGDGIVARGGDEAFFVSKAGETRELGAARFISSDGRRVAIFPPGGLDRPARLLDASLEDLDAHLPDHLEEISAPPVLRGSRLWLPLQSGVLRTHSLETGDQISVAVGNGPLSEPVVGVSGSWALVPTPGGKFCTVQLNDRREMGVPSQAQSSSAMPRAGKNCRMVSRWAPHERRPYGNGCM